MASLRMTLLDLLNKSEHGADPNFLRDGQRMIANKMGSRSARLVWTGDVLDLDDLSPVVGEDGASVRTSENVRELQHPHAVQWAAPVSHAGTHGANYALIIGPNGFYDAPGSYSEDSADTYRQHAHS